MGIRVGASRRTRHGSVWASMPLSLALPFLALVFYGALIAIPFIVTWIVVKVIIAVVAVTIRAIHDYRKGRERE